jgi:ABC-2 type transport system permease protein
LKSSAPEHRRIQTPTHNETPNGTGGETWGYVKTICSLKLRVLRNALVRDKRSRVTLILMTIGALGAALVWGYSFYKDANAGPIAWRRSLIPVFTSIFVGWCFGPLLLGGVDDMVDPAKLVTLPIPRRALVLGLLGASTIGTFPLATVVALLGAVVGHGRSFARILPVLFVAITMFVLCIVAARLLAVGLALMRRFRRGRDLAILLAAASAAGLWLVTQSLHLLGGARFDTLVGWMRWTPPGMLGQAVIDIRRDAYGSALLRTLFVCILIIVGAVVWIRALGVQLVSPAANSRPTSRRSAVRVSVPRAGTPKLARVLLGREIRYLLRSPQRRSALLVGVVIGPMFALLQAAQVGSKSGVLLAPIALLFGVGSANNLIGADAPSLWIEQSCGVPVRTMLRARSVGSLPYIALPPLVSVVMISLIVGGPTKLALFVVLLLITTLGIPLGVGAVISVVAPFPQIDSDNPFSNQRPTAGEGCLIGVLGFVGLVATTVLATPVALGGIFVFHSSGTTVAIATLCALVYSVGIWWIATFVASARVARAGSIMLEGLARRNATA